ncbi:MAG TPA: 3-deoxy-manno-octulosonate cytidylyltransferase [Planctomycetaceae bacterium]|jgi:3-deoxy-manno-octulosonate cytidylyltransferase (CMP-KDO synthetase)|nr:3-deoxy-manno-octulosonate cytidylyltransferase [Planctomycetaceae bacterium]
MRVFGIIPARLQSSRLPRKLLLAETGQTLLQYTWEQACRAKSLSEVIIATDSPEIATTVKKFGGRVEMTGEHPSGTDRIAEVVRRSCREAQVVVNVQGDEPEIDPAHIDLLVKTLHEHPGVEMSTLATPITSRRELDDHSCNKVVCADDGRALYFSRATIPFVRDAVWDELLQTNSPWLLHLGLYAYRVEFLLELCKLPPSRLEKLEKLEQLRVLEMGARIQVAVVDQRSVGIDTPEDYARFVEREQMRRREAA